MVLERWCTAHIAQASINLFRETFEERVLSKNADFSWQLRFLNLTAPNFFDDDSQTI